MKKFLGRKTILFLALGLVLVAIGAVSSATSSQRQVGNFVAQLPPQATTPTQAPTASGHRHIPPDPGVPLMERLEPTDQVVEVIMSATPFNDPSTDAEEELAVANTAPIVAVIGVGQRESRFARMLVPGDWIRTTLTADVRQVLKDTTGQLVEGNVIEIQESGGEVVLPDGRRIIARYSVVRPTKIGGTYLAVLGVDNEGRFSIDTLFSLELDNGKVKRMRRDAQPNTGVETKSPEWVVQQVREVARRKP